MTRWMNKECFQPSAAEEASTYQLLLHVVEDNDVEISSVLQTLQEQDHPTCTDGTVPSQPAPLH